MNVTNAWCAVVPAGIGAPGGMVNVAVARPSISKTPRVIMNPNVFACAIDEFRYGSKFSGTLKPCRLKPASNPEALPATR